MAAGPLGGAGAGAGAGAAGPLTSSMGVSGTQKLALPGNRATSTQLMKGMKGLKEFLSAPMTTFNESRSRRAERIKQERAEQTHNAKQSVVHNTLKKCLQDIKKLKSESMEVKDMEVKDMEVKDMEVKGALDLLGKKFEISPESDTITFTSKDSNYSDNKIQYTGEEANNLKLLLLECATPEEIYNNTCKNSEIENLINFCRGHHEQCEDFKKLFYKSDFIGSYNGRAVRATNAYQKRLLFGNVLYNPKGDLPEDMRG